MTLSTLSSKGKDKKKKKQKGAASGWGIPAVEEATVLVDEAPASEEASRAPEHVYWKWPRYGAWNYGATRDVPTEPQDAVEEPTQSEEPCPVAPDEPSHPDEPYNIVPMDEPEPKDAFTAREPVYNEDPMAAERPAPDATPEPSQAELIPKVLDDTEEHTLNQYDNVVRDLVDSYELAPVPDVAPMPSPQLSLPSSWAPPQSLLLVPCATNLIRITHVLHRRHPPQRLPSSRPLQPQKRPQRKTATPSRSRFSTAARSSDQSSSSKRAPGRQS